MVNLGKVGYGFLRQALVHQSNDESNASKYGVNKNKVFLGQTKINNKIC